MKNKRKNMVAELLLEIGTEEIPSGYIEKGLEELRRLAENSLKENRIEIAGGLYTYGTPRRLVLIGKAIAVFQNDLELEITGPPKKVAYDLHGNPTKAAIGFAEKQGVSVQELSSIETSKGEYLFIKKLIKGRPTNEILQEALPSLISDIPWPKSMRWGELDFNFPRPIHWVLALFDGEVIPFEIAGIKSNRITRGHRFMSPMETEILNIQDYLSTLDRLHVILDQKERETVIEGLAGDVANAIEGKLGQDAELTSTIANLVEYPSAVCGSFDKKFLSLPDCVLITAMKKHQKYFAVYDSNDRLMPNFVAINNTITKNESIVQKGHERVLRARLSDADFFFKEDLKIPLRTKLDNLKGVIYQAELGTSYEKVMRFTKLANYLANAILPERINDVETASLLCKCDLVTHMVTEFPNLQGEMGKEYARLENYNEDICNAIHEHYLPSKSGGELPCTDIGAIVGLADRMDTIAGCFAIGLEPTGSADPFALRRNAIAIIRIIEDKDWDISLSDLITTALTHLGEKVVFDIDDVFARILAFFSDRYKNMLKDSFDSDLIEAIISVDFDRVHKLRIKLSDMNKFMAESEESKPLITTFKRITNILKKQDNTFTVNPGLFKNQRESILWEIYNNLKQGINDSIKRQDFYGSLNIMAELRGPVDGFFDEVEVLTKESKELQENRVGLLQCLSRLFLSVADFSKFSI